MRRSDRVLGVVVGLLGVLLVCVYAGPAGGGVVTGVPVLVDGSHALMPRGCGSGGQECRQELVGANGRWKLTSFSNFPMSGSTVPTEAVVVVHGTGRNAAGYFASMMAAATKAGVVDHTLVIAPWFKTSADKPAGGEAVWTNDTWKDGEGALSPAGLSSFTVADQVVAALGDRARFPNLRRITLAGHSAGGQFVQRYAAFGRGSNATQSGTAVNYVVANPSSFVYFGPDRPSGSGFVVPSGSSCRSFNDYKYGLAGRSGYPAALSPDQAVTNYTSRQVTVLTGSDDTANNGDEDRSCGAKMEGPNRASRAANYLTYIHALAPDAPHDRVVIPGVAHDSDAMFSSPLAWPALFGVRERDQAGESQ